MVQAGAGQPRPQGLPCDPLLVATGVPHDPCIALHALEDQHQDAKHRLVHQRGGAAWLSEHLTGLWSLASTIAGAGVQFRYHPAIHPYSTMALGVDYLTPTNSDVR